MKLLSWVILIVVLGLFLKSSDPEMYNDTFGKAIEQGQSMWDERKDLFNSSKQNGDKINNDGSLDTVREGNLFGRPWDEYTYRFDCINDAQCQQRFSVFALCNNQTGECVQGPTE